MTTSTKTALFTTAMSLIALAATSAHAQTPATTAPVADDKMGLSVGVNVIASKTAYDMDDKVAVLPSLFYDNGTVYARGSQFGGYLVNDDSNEIAAFLQPAGGNFDPDETDGALRQLDERKVSAMAGASYLRSTPYGGFRAQISTDVSGRSEGTLARLTYIARLSPGKWTIYPSAGFEWASENYNEYYYGVTKKESDKSGVRSYSPDSSINPYISINGTYAVNNDWDVFVGQSIKYLSDEQHDSPMVDDRMDYRTTLGLLYKF